MYILLDPSWKVRAVYPHNTCAFEPLHVSMHSRLPPWWEGRTIVLISGHGSPLAREEQWVTAVILLRMTVGRRCRAIVGFRGGSEKKKGGKKSVNSPL